MTRPSDLRWFALAGLALLAGCGPEATRHSPAVTRELFGFLPSEDSVHVYTLTNSGGMEVRVIQYGGIILSLKTPERRGSVADIVLGHDSLAGYLRASPYFGAIVGRYANRIARGRFTLDGRTYRLATNNGSNHLHGGITGFDKALWAAEPFQSDSGVGVLFTHTSGDGEEGYPGTLSVRVRYLLTDSNQLILDYHATTDKPTPVNLTQHSYFNLAGHAAGDILRHVLMINASHYTPVDSTLIPIGDIAPVEGTPLDFRAPTPIGARIAQRHEQLRRGGGYDHNFVLDRDGPGLAHAARVVEPSSGRTLDVYTTEPGVQFYSGNFLDSTISGKGGYVYPRRGGFCLETQHFPDSPNQPSFPSTILRPGEEYRSRTVWRFGVER